MHPDPGSSDFESIFASAAEARREDDERRQLEAVLRALEARLPAEPAAPAPPVPPGWWQTPAAAQAGWGWNPPDGPAGPWGWQPPPASGWGWHAPQAWRAPPRVEHLRVLASGDIDREDEAERAADRLRVRTLDDLPQESLMDMLMPPAPEPEPDVVVRSGRRLRDGKTIHTMLVPGLEGLSLDWSGLSPEFVITACSLVAFVAMLVLFYVFGRLRAALLAPPRDARAARAERAERAAAAARLDARLDARIDSAVERALERVARRAALVV
jgi:hypothetical protein